MTTVLVADGRAVRAHLDEEAWARAVVSAGTPPLPGWASPRPDDGGRPTGAGDAPEAEDGDVAETLAVRGRSVLLVEVATTSGAAGVLGELATDLTTVSGVVRRLTVSAGAGPAGARALTGVEVSATTADHVVDEVLRLLPAVPEPGSLVEAEVDEELTVALGRALRTGDAPTVDAVCEDQGWPDVPEVLRALVQELVGSATVTVRRHGAGPVVGRWMLTRRGWVELVPTPRRTVRHVPRTRDDIARSLVTALAGAASAVLADAARAARTAGEDGRG